MLLDRGSSGDMVTRPRKFNKKLCVGTAIILSFLALLFRKVDFKQLAAALSEVDLNFLVAALGTTFASCYARALRWDYLLLPLKRCPMATVFPATIIGLMVNCLFPARLGELARTYVLAEREDLGKGSVFATLVLDRLMDVISLVLLLMATLFWADLPADLATDRQALVTGGYGVLVFSLVVVGVLALLKSGKMRLPAANSRVLRLLPPKLTEGANRVLDSFVHGICLPGKLSHTFAITGSSLIAWFLSVIAVYLVLRSFGIALPLSASMFILVMLTLAVMVPATPGYVGTYHYACFTALGMYNIPQPKALSVALIIHGVSFLPVMVAGFYFLWKDGLSFRQLRVGNQVPSRADG